MQLTSADWMALALSPGIGPVRCGALLRGELDATAAAAVVAQAREAVTCRRVQRLLDWCAHNDTTLVTPADDDYPAVLAMIPDPPPMLFVRGDARLLTRPQIAVVGARRASRRGLADAGWVAGELTRAGLLVTSGLALGVDGAAHEAALAAGGFTVAVLGSGPDRIYPVRHLDLAARVRQRGALVTEFMPGMAPAPHHFPRRNRLISGLSLGVVVVEAAEHSGSLITARLAAAQGREVFAMPTTARDPGGRGCHRLIREGARLLTRIDDVLEELPPELCASLKPPSALPAETPDGAQAQNEEPLLALFDAEGSVFDELLLRSGLDAATLNARLFELELDGRVAREQQRWVRIL
ncbi:MAG: DNA-processing protein DprA [Gammaproteobacteria bacterium]|nr:DNA-processing protein DprA [Gammaproteobacteria bacterium]